MPKFYTEHGTVIRNPQAYAATGAPIFDYKGKSANIIYKVNCDNNKKYIGKTNNIERRVNQHFSGNGSKVTQKFKPKTVEIIDVCSEYSSSAAEQFHTEENIKKYGYENVRGGRYTNSKTLHKTKKGLYYENMYHEDEDEDGDY
tara:strand:- start:71 stop:502 length:432 start_codon:yes stop_codon:yes gene_type:complete